MTQRIGQSLLAREALLAAMEAKKRQATQMGSQLPTTGLPASGAPATGPGFPSALEGAREASASRSASADGPGSVVESLKGGLEDVNRNVQRAEALDEALVTGKVQDFHEVAVQLKQADLSFRFALEVRNRLIDAYREVMRMNV